MTPHLSHRPSARRAGSELLVLARWEEFTGWLLAHTARWPRSARFTLCRRVQDHALDITELLVVARYERGRRRNTLRDVNLRLERMRLLFRLAVGAGVMPRRGFETAMRGVDEAGRMVHGWRERLADEKAPEEAR
ncbi:MAG: four helix bundle protein [Planctomycetota bacterium]